MTSKEQDLARDIDYVVSSSRGDIHDCGQWMSDKEAAVRHASSEAQRQGWPFDVYEVRHIGRAKPTKAEYVTTKPSKV